MMRRIIFLLAALLGCVSYAYGNEAAHGWCESGATIIITSGLNSNNFAQGSFPSCTVSVFTHGGGLATIYSDNANTPLANPFTASPNGQWIFYAPQSRVDVTMTGGGLTGPVTYSDILLSDPAQDATNQCVLAPSTTPAFNAGICSIFSMTLTAAAAASISGGIPGQSITVSLTQGSGGPWAFTWPSSFVNPPTFTQVAGASAQFRFVLLADGLWHHSGTGESLVYNTAQYGNQFYINSNPITGVSGSGGTVLEQTSPTINTPSINALSIINAATASKLNKVLAVDGVQYTTLAAALAACPSVGCIVYVPDGVNPTLSSVLTITNPVHLVFGRNTITCTMTDPGVASGCLVVASDNVEIEGQGPTTLFTQPSAQNIEVGIQLNAHGNIKIHDMMCNWNDQTQTNTSFFYSCIRSSAGSHDLRFYNLTITQGGNRGLDIRGANRVWLQNNYFFTTGYHVAGLTPGNGSPASIDIDGTTNSTDVYCENNQVDLAGDALACVGLRVHVNHNTIRGAADFGLTPLSTEAAIDESRSQDAEIIGNVVVNGAGPQLSTQSIAVVGGPSGLGQNYQISGNSFIVNTTCCGIATSDPRVLVGSIAGGGLTSGQSTSYNFINNNLQGVRVTSDTINGLVIKGNTFHNISSSIAAGIAIDLEQVANGFGSKMENFVVSGNTFSTDNSTLLTAINLGNGITTPDSCVITDNATSTGVTTDVFANTSFAASTCLITRSNKSIGTYSSGQTSPVAPITNGFTDTGIINFKRLRANQGTTLTTGSFVLSSGWGTSPTIPILFGTDSSFIIQITSGSGTPTADPFVTFTFADGAWPVAPSCTATRGDEFSPIAATWSITSLTATQMVFVFVGTPLASTSYIANFTCIGR